MIQPQFIHQNVAARATGQFCDRAKQSSNCSSKTVYSPDAGSLMFAPGNLKMAQDLFVIVQNNPQIAQTPDDSTTVYSPDDATRSYVRVRQS